MFEGRLNDLKKTFGDTDIIFVGKNSYFKVNFSQIELKDLKRFTVKFKLFCIKMCKGENFDEEDIDSTTDYKEDPEVISAKIVDKIENSKGIDLTQHLAKSSLKILKNKDNEEDKKIYKYHTGTKTTTIDTSKITFQNAKTKKEIERIAKDLEDEVDYFETDTEDNERTAAINKLSDAIAIASKDSDSEEDALDMLDTDEINRILISLGDDDEVNISAARSTRMSNLDKAIMDKEIHGKSIRDILSTEKTPEETTTVAVASPNSEEWSGLSFVNLDKNYDIDKDILSIFKMFANCTRPMVIKDINVTDNSNSEDRVMLYDVQMEDYKGRRFRIKLDIPIMEDNRFLLRGNSKSIQTQFFVMPIIKTDLSRCQLSSNYRKIFIDRFGGNGGRSLPATSKLLINILEID